MELVIYARSVRSYGVLVIVDNFIKACAKQGIRCRCTSSLDNIREDELLIPYGTLETVELISKGIIPRIAFLVDAISLGVKNKFWKYTRVGHVWNKDYLYSFLRIFKWGYLDRRIANNVKNIMLVSEADGTFLKRFNHSLSVIICRNGLISAKTKPHISSDKFRFGILSSWNSIGSYEENNWFIRTYWRKYAELNDNVELIIAGRGAYTSRLCGLPKVKVIGEVQDLGDFFSQIDVFLAVNPKGCGILNRCLDAFVYKVPVIGHIGSVSGFGYMEDSFLSFDTYDDFLIAVANLRQSNELMMRVTENAYKYAIKYNNWDVNYFQLVEQVKQILELKDEVN